MDWSAWQRLAGSAVAAAEVPVLLSTDRAGSAPFEAWWLLHNALHAAGADGRRWSRLLWTAGLSKFFEIGPVLNRLWPLAAAFGWPEGEVARLRAMLADDAPIGGDLTITLRPDAGYTALWRGKSESVCQVSFPDGRVLSTLT